MKCCTLMIIFLSNTEKMEDLTTSKGSDLTMSCQEIPIETPGKFFTCIMMIPINQFKHFLA